MKWFRGPWVWDVSNPAMPHWRAPDGCIGCLDLRSIPEQSQAGGVPGLGVFVLVGDARPGSDYDLLGSGAHRDIKVSAKLKAALPKRRLKQLEGDDLLGLLWSTLTTNADPDGDEFAKPLVPGMDGRLSLHIAGLTHYERFEWGRSKETAAVKQLLRREFSALMDDAESGRLKDREHHRRCLDSLCEKYGVDDWTEFVPLARQKDVPGRLKHETTISESFDKADSDTLGPDLTWAEPAGDWDVVSNTCEMQTIGSVPRARAESDLSSADHYAQCDVTVLGATAEVGPACRFSASAYTLYTILPYTTTNQIEVYKFVAGASTRIANPGITISLPEAYKCQCNGSNIKAYQAGVERASVTDTSISGNLRTGLLGFNGGGTKPRVDNFIASDLAASGLLYTQLDRNWPRGLKRGMFTSWGG